MTVKTKKIALPKAVSKEEWLAARKELLNEEKELTRARDRINAKRRRLPMVEIKKEYVFQGPGGEASLLDLFQERRQLMVHHFMWFEDSDTFCHGCSLEADQNYNVPFFAQIADCDVTIAAVSRAPLERILEEKTVKGWDFPFYSSYGTDFNYDFQATLEAGRNTMYNYQSDESLDSFGGYQGDLPARSVFLRDADKVYHTYSGYTRGLGLLATHYNYLDMTPYGRQEEWEDSPQGWPQKPTYG